MGARGRKSSGDLLIAAQPASIEVTERQRPPDGMNDEETEVWFSVVSSEEATWFTPANKPLLSQYVRHIVQAKRIAELLERALSDKNLSVDDYGKLLAMQDRESRAIAMLATKMRITNQSTINQRGNRQMTFRRKPWET